VEYSPAKNKIIIIKKKIIIIIIIKRVEEKRREWLVINYLPTCVDTRERR